MFRGPEESPRSALQATTTRGIHPRFPVVPIAFVVARLWAAGFMALREPGEAAMGLGTALLGIPVYFWLRSREPR